MKQAPSVDGVGGFAVARGHRRRGGQPKGVFFSSIAAGNGPFIGDPVLLFPFPNVPYDLSVTTLTADVTRPTVQTSRLDWTVPDVNNSTWCFVENGTLTASFQIWYAITNNVSQAQTIGRQITDFGLQ